MATAEQAKLAEGLSASLSAAAAGGMPLDMAVAMLLLLGAQMAVSGLSPQATACLLRQLADGVENDLASVDLADLLLHARPEGSA